MVVLCFVASSCALCFRCLIWVCWWCGVWVAAGCFVCGGLCLIVVMWGWCTLLLVVVVLFVVWFVCRFEGCLIGWGMYWCTRLCIVIGVCFSVLN